MRAKLLIVNCPLVPSARGPCSSVSTGWSMAAKDQKTPKRESQFQNIKHVNAEGFKTRFSVLYLLPHSHQFLNIRPLNISCDDCITGMWRIYKLVDLPNLVATFIKSNVGTAARCSRFVSREDGTSGVVTTISLNSSTELEEVGGTMELEHQQNGAKGNGSLKGNGHHLSWLIYKIGGGWWYNYNGTESSSSENILGQQQSSKGHRLQEQETGLILFGKRFWGQL